MDDPESAARAAIESMVTARAAIASARASRDAAVVALHERGMRAADIERLLADIAEALGITDVRDLGLSESNIMYVLRVHRAARAAT